LKVINHRYTWAFAVDLLSKDVFVDYGLLCLWGLQKEYELELLPTIETWDLFAAKAETDGVDFMYLNRGTSVYTRVTEIFLNISTVTKALHPTVGVLGCILS
jgi:hypothetical protein